MKGVPPSLNALKVEAKSLKKTNGTKHSECLESVAKSYGFSNFHEAVKFYNRSAKP